LQYQPSAIQALYASDNLNDTFKALAISMTNAIRSGSDDDSPLVNGTKFVTGWIGNSVTYYKIQWPWVVLPCIVVLAGHVHLLLTAAHVKKSGVPVWKSNSIAIMSRGPHVAELLQDVDAMSIMNEKARRETVQLFPLGGRSKAVAISY
jgi:hypothetical protein